MGIVGAAVRMPLGEPWRVGTSTMPANPLAPRKGGRRHPKMLPDEGRGRPLRKATTARDRMIVTWLYDGGFRIGELCGLHLADLHLPAPAGTF